MNGTVGSRRYSLIECDLELHYVCISACSFTFYRNLTSAIHPSGRQALASIGISQPASGRRKKREREREIFCSILLLPRTTENVGSATDRPTDRQRVRVSLSLSPLSLSLARSLEPRSERSDRQRWIIKKERCLRLRSGIKM